MAFDKKYPNRKDKRKPYRDSRRFDRTCRCHGSCAWCRGKRTFTNRKREAEAQEELRQLARGEAFFNDVD